MPRHGYSRFRKRSGILACLISWAIIGCMQADPPYQPGWDPCPSDSGTGTLTINITGLPAGLDTGISLLGPSGRVQIPPSRTFTNLRYGTYRPVGALIVQPDSLVPGLYMPVNPSGSCFRDSAATMDLPFQLMPASNKAWVTTSAGNEMAGLSGFASSQLGSGAAQEPAASLPVPGLGGHQAFTGDGILVSTSRRGIQTLHALKTAPMGEIRLFNLDIDSLACEPDDIAIGKGRFLHIAVNCEKAVYYYRYDEYCCASGSLRKYFTHPVPMGVVSIAFDADGDLWAATGEGHILWYRSEEAWTNAPSFILAFPSPTPGGMPLDPTGLAFDAQGRLWAYDRGGQGIFSVTPADLGAPGSKSLPVHPLLPAGLGTLRGKLAFDGSGGLWVAGSAGFARFSPAQLREPSPANPMVPERVFASGNASRFDNLLFFPPPATLDLDGG